MLSASISTDEQFEGFNSCGSPTGRWGSSSSESPLRLGSPRGRSTDDYYGQTDEDDTQRFRSPSFSVRFIQAGGLNSFDNFARSWQRAALFPEVLPQQSSFTAPDSGGEPVHPEDDYIEPQGHPIFDGHEGDITQPLLGFDGDVERRKTGSSLPKKMIQSAGNLSSSLDRNLGASYGTISSRIGEATRRHAIQFHREQQARTNESVNRDREPILMKQVINESGACASVIVGQSTVPQTIFNSVNVLIGVGLLSLPLAMKQAGWLFGLSFLLFAAATTSYTARILAKCLDVDNSLVTYADLAYISFGNHARLLTSLLFCLELIGACVALVVLFADSLHVLIPGLTILQWKIICGLMLVPLNFIPLRLLSITSILGILSCTSIVLIISVDGFIKSTSPGSLRQPAATSLFPENWKTLPLSFGLIMSPWGGHGVFPNIYRDMRHPKKYGRSLWFTYIFTYSLDCTMAIVGWLMFGDAVRDEVTGNVLEMAEYPQALSVCIVCFIAIIPITKVPLNCRPLVATVDVLCGLEMNPGSSSSHPANLKKFIYQSSKAIIRMAVIVMIVLVAILFPYFDRIMALMGSALCFTICIILPLTFHLKIFGKEIRPRERAVNWGLLAISSVAAFVGTLWAFLPQRFLAS